MKAFKFLGVGARARFGRVAWPIPTSGEPAAWVRVALPLKPCVRGVHACRQSDLPFWIDDELWRIELDGQIVHGKSMVVAERGRLLARVPRWDASLREELALFCRERTQAVATRALAEGRADAVAARRFLDDVTALGELGQVATAAYIAAVAARCDSELSAEDAYLAERAVQSAWLAERLD
ncbi:MAG: hypothetical protein RLZZ450_589 [Pseudomonadota bacterium]